MKLTLVSITIKGKHYTRFINLPVDKEGKVTTNKEELFKELPSFDRGITYSIG